MAPDTPMSQRPLEMEPPVSSPAYPSATRPKYTPPPYHHSYWRLRIPLVALEAFVALIAIYGALYSALALGIVCGAGALIALISVLAWPRIGAIASMIAGVAMGISALVEMLVVGFTAAMYPTQPVAWLQLLYIVAGLAFTLLGARLWKAETGAYTLTWQALRRGIEGGAA